MPTKVLDLKSFSHKPSSVVKKGKDDGFRKELDKKQKQSNGSDALSAGHSVRVEDRGPLSKGKQNESAESKKSQPAQAIKEKARASSPSTAPSESAAKPAEPSQVAITENTAEAAMTDTTEFKNMQMMALQENPVATDGLLSLEGMDLVKPQAMVTDVDPAVTEMPSLDISEKTGALVESILSGSQGEFSESDLSKGSDGEGLSPDVLSEALNPQTAGLQKANDVTFESVVKAAVASDVAASQEANVDNLVQSARTLIKDGGGEMQIKLNPDGLGAVNLKVGVQGGEVSIEILAQDNMVKKMFEDGMVEIRSALEMQNLKMDNFKVEVSQQTEQNVNDQQQDSSNREFARDFMNQFRGERQAMRNQGLSYDMERSPDFSKSPEGLRPAQTSTGANGRLNIVA